MTDNHTSPEVTVPWWWRPAVTAAAAVAGLMLFGLGAGFGEWFFNYHDGAETTVVCNEYTLGEDEGTIEVREDGCLRATEEVTRSFVYGWPLIWAAPVFIVAVLLSGALTIVGVCGGIYLIWMTWHEDTKKDLQVRRTMQLAHRRARGEAKKNR